MRQGRELVHVDADREGAAAHRLPVRAEHVVTQCLAMRLADDVALEMLNVLIGLQPDQIKGEERPHKPLVLRDGRHDFLRRQRDVQEEAHALLAAHGAQFSRQRNQVVVVNPDDVVRLKHRHQLAREQLVDAPVSADETCIEVRQIEPVMEHRP